MLEITPPLNFREKLYIVVMCATVLLFCAVIGWSLVGYENYAADQHQKAWRHR
jgi:hypothetical protein